MDDELLDTNRTDLPYGKYRVKRILRIRFLREALSRIRRTRLPKSLDEMSIEEIGQMMQMELTTYEAENDDGEMVTYVDMRPMMKQLIASGAMTQDGIAQSREYMENMIDSVGKQYLTCHGNSICSIL